MNGTLNFYSQNASAFFESTLGADMRETRSHFLAFLSPQASILDFGCGSGRDAKAFLELGYKVSAMDGSEELCHMASEFAGIKVECRLFSDLSEMETYDGIWACASILHVPSAELPDIIRKMTRALKMHGIFYASFKYGEFEGERNGRYFTDMTEKKFAELLKSSNISGIRIREQWISMDVRPERKDEKWLNVLAEKI